MGSIRGLKDYGVSKPINEDQAGPSDLEVGSSSTI